MKKSGKPLKKSVKGIPPPPASAPGSLLPGWSLARPRSIPPMTFWPAIMALGITLIAWSVATSAIVAAIGAAVFAVSLAGWIAEALHDQED